MGRLDEGEWLENEWRSSDLEIKVSRYFEGDPTGFFVACKYPVPAKDSLTFAGRESIVDDVARKRLEAKMTQILEEEIVNYFRERRKEVPSPK